MCVFLRALQTNPKQVSIDRVCVYLSIHVCILVALFFVYPSPCRASVVAGVLYWCDGANKRGGSQINAASVSTHIQQVSLFIGNHCELPRSFIPPVDNHWIKEMWKDKNVRKLAVPLIVF